MSQRNSTPIAWRPKGCSDTLDASQAFSGAMASLQNLVPDPTTSGLFQCRPAAIKLTNFAGFSSPGFISIAKVFGRYVYGLIATSRNPGYDEPFVFDLQTNLFVTLTGVTSTNVPASPSTTGAWTPPTMDVIGSKVVVTHPGFTGGFGTYFGYFDISTPTAPAWHGGNCSGANFMSFTVPPIAVAQFNNRAYFIHNLVQQPAVIISDQLNPLTNSAGAFVPVLTFGDSVPLTALAGLPLNTTIGGIIQSLMVVKDSRNIYQVTGDPTLTANPLVINTLNVPTGTLAPAALVPTPQGLAFVSPDGLRFIDFTARIGNIVGQDGKGISIPFSHSNVPSRMIAASNGEVLRISTQNAFLPNTPYQEWWFDYGRQIFTGPHTSAMTSLSPYKGTFIGVLQGVNAALWQSDYQQNNTSTYVENGSQLSCNYFTSFLPDTDQMTNNSMIMATLDLALAAGQASVVVNAYDQNGVVIDSVLISPSGTAPLWGQVNWGSFIWGGTQNPLVPRIIPWDIPVCFVKLQIGLTVPAVSGFKVGTLHLRYKVLRLLTNIGAAA